MKLYIVVDIGCLECGNPSNLVGVYTTRAEALATGAEPRSALPDEDAGGREWSGEGMLVMFEADGPCE